MIHSTDRPFVVVIAPVCQRAWILDRWFDSIANLGLSPGNIKILLNYGLPVGEEDDGTREIIARQGASGRWHAVETLRSSDSGHLAGRKWNRDRYELMSKLRNELLQEANEMSPSFVLSIDTDVLLRRGAFIRLVEAMVGGGYDSISPLMYMTPAPSTKYPNAMDPHTGSRVTVPDDRPHLQVPSAFGASVMSGRFARAARYETHKLGEDLGLAVNMEPLGYRFGWLVAEKAKHVMGAKHLAVVDPRVGF